MSEWFQPETPEDQERINSLFDQLKPIRSSLKDLNAVSDPLADRVAALEELRREERENRERIERLREMGLLIPTG